MDDGFYTITYVGVAGMGLCTLLLENGRVRGFDMRGGQYDGSYTRDRDGILDMKAMLVVAPASRSSRGFPRGTKPFLLPVTARLAADLDDSTTVAVAVGDRQVQAIFKRMRGL